MQLFDSVSRWISEIPIGRRPRSGPRVAINDQILLRTSGEDVRPVLLRNLSSGGACVRTDLALAVGEVLRLRVKGDEEPFELVAKVIAVRAHRLAFFWDYGLRIIEVTMDNARRLNAYIDRRLEVGKVASNGHTNGKTRFGANGHTVGYTPTNGHAKRPEAT